MISHIFANMHITLQRIANQSKTPQRRGFRLAAEITSRLIRNNIHYAFIIEHNTVYFEELDKYEKIVEVVALDIETGKYTVIDLDEYLKIS